MLDPRTGAVHVASELRRPLQDAAVAARVGDRRWNWRGDIPADSLTYVGRVEVPLQASSAELTLTHADIGVVINAYGGLVLAVGGAARDGC
jgi:hypothetical protein